MYHLDCVVGKKYQDGPRVLTPLFVCKEGVYFFVEPRCSTSNATEVFMNRHDYEFWSRLVPYQKTVKKFIFCWKSKSCESWISGVYQSREITENRLDDFKNNGYIVTEISEVILKVLE